MTSLPQEELEARLSAIQEGPWSKGVTKAIKRLSPFGRLTPGLKGTQLISLENLDLSAANKRKSRELERILRPHYLGDDVIDETEIEIRDALDEALTIPQLYELAVQTGYLPEASVKPAARSIMTDLLWSPPARRFVEAYDYVAIPMLATRVGVLGFGPSTPIEPNPGAAIRFAGFLAHLRAFYSDETIESWLAFLDDYLVEDGEQDSVWEFLRGELTAQPARIQGLLAGCQRFVTSLASAFHFLPENELGQYGLMHAYWLQKFFGYERNAKGRFVKNVEQWGQKDSWAKSFSMSAALISEGIEPAIRDLLRRQFIEEVGILEHAFEAVRNLTRRTRRDRSSRTTPRIVM
jgi:hypothetical protein